MLDANEGAFQDFINNLKEDPETFRQLKEKLAAAATDDEKAEVLVNFATTDSDLIQALPDDIGSTGPQAFPITVTVTVTVTISPPTAY